MALREEAGEAELMPFDHETGGGANPNDPRHEPIWDLVTIAVEALGAEGKKRNLCMSCLARQSAGTALALFLMQQDAVNLDTGEIDTDEAERLVQHVLDKAMDEIGRTIEGRKLRKGG